MGRSVGSRCAARPAHPLVHHRRVAHRAPGRGRARAPPASCPAQRPHAGGAGRGDHAHRRLRRHPGGQLGDGHRQTGPRRTRSRLTPTTRQHGPPVLVTDQWPYRRRVAGTTARPTATLEPRLVPHLPEPASTTRNWKPWQSDPMADPTTPLPAAKAFGEDERAVLLGYLTYHRTVLARKAEGVTDEQAHRAACPPSGLTLLGLIRHMTDVERWWFRRVLLAEDVAPLFDDDEEWDLPADATMNDALGAYWDEIA